LSWNACPAVLAAAEEGRPYEGTRAGGAWHGRNTAEAGAGHARRGRARRSVLEAGRQRAQRRWQQKGTRRVAECRAQACANAHVYERACTVAVIWQTGLW